MAEDQLPDDSARLNPAILLVDMDSFFASVEVRDDPSLRGRPVLVGGDGARGVVASCSYEARRFGIHSAMPMVTARRLCPQAVVLPGDFSRYSAVSAQLRAILLDATPLVEPLGLDEAFLDVTGSVGLLGTPLTIARSIRARVAEELDLACAVGIGPSKLIAKLASRDAKPTVVDGKVRDGPGEVVVMPEQVAAYLERLDVGALYGVGPATVKTLARLGIITVRDLAAMDPVVLERHLGSGHAHGLVDLARGIDPRPVVPNQVSKSIGHEETYATDLTDRVDLEVRLRRQAVAVSSALRDAHRRARTISVKLKYATFTLRTRSHTLSTGLDDAEAIFTVARALLASLSVEEGVRLLGISASGLEPVDQPTQLRLEMGAGADGDPAAEAERLQIERAALDDAVSKIRTRFGRDALGAASMLSDDGVSVPRQRQEPFGPKDEAS